MFDENESRTHQIDFEISRRTSVLVFRHVEQLLGISLTLKAVFSIRERTAALRTLTLASSRTDTKVLA